MPANASITLLDGKASPASHAFTPIRSTEAGGNTYRDQSMSPVGVADTINYKLTDLPKLRRIRATLLRPRAVSETVNAVVSTKKADFMSVTVEFNVPLTWSEADIKDSRVIAANLFANALIVAAVDRGEGSY